VAVALLGLVLGAAPTGAALAAPGHALAAAVPARAADGPSVRHLIYLHGRIVQAEQSRRPVHPRFGPYELDAILETLREAGFEVTGEVRPKAATVSESADRVVRQVRALLVAGVPADHVSVVGASMGAGIALLASVRLQEPGVRFSLLGLCLSKSTRALEAEEGRGPRGRILSIREGSDDFTEPCPAWEGDEASLTVREIRLQTGLAHGFLYRPLPQWVKPVVEWSSAP